MGGVISMATAERERWTGVMTCVTGPMIMIRTGIILRYSEL